MNRIIKIWTILFSCVLHGQEPQFFFADFKASMQCNVSSNFAIVQKVENQLSKWLALYEKAKIYSGDSRTIPHIIHQIWLGGPLPEKFKKWCASWQKFHPGWIYKLWTDEDAAVYPFVNKELFEKATNLGEKADIWRYELLYKFGGVYADIDEECLRAFDQLHDMFDFYTGLQSLDSGYLQLGIAVIGCIAQHPLLGKAVSLLKESKHAQIVIRTGPIYFTSICLQYAGNTGLRDIIFPATYFYPCGYTQAGKSIHEWLQPESFAVHHWAGSWLK